MPNLSLNETANFTNLACAQLILKIGGSLLSVLCWEML